MYRLTGFSNIANMESVAWESSDVKSNVALMQSITKTPEKNTLVENKNSSLSSDCRKQKLQPVVNCRKREHHKITQDQDQTNQTRPKTPD